PHRRAGKARGEGHAAPILVGRSPGGRRSDLHRRLEAMGHRDKPIPAHPVEFRGGHRPHAEGRADEREVGAREGGDDHADARHGCGGGRRGSVEPGAERRRHDDAGVPDASGEPESGLDVTETEGEAPAESPDLGDVPTGADDGSTGAEDDLPAEPSKSGYLVFPDQTEQPIPESQWLIGRADLAKFLPDPEMANEISRGHLTVFQEGERFFVEDGTTMVQRRPSTNKTWLVRGSSRILVTGTGRT